MSEINSLSLLENDLIADFRASCGDHAFWKLDHGIGAQTHRNAPGFNRAAEFDNAKLSIQKHDINGKLHEKAVDRFARQDPDRFSPGR